MKVYLASDHAGFALKEKIKAFLLEKSFIVEDCGSYTYDAGDDYPDFVSIASQKVSDDPEQSRGILVAGSGQAEAMLANKYKGVRCALFYAPVIPTQAADVTGRISNNPYEIIRLTREHNNSNMLSLGGRFLTEEQATHAVELWLAEPFPRDARHVRRLEKMAEIEKHL